MSEAHLPAGTSCISARQYLYIDFTAGLVACATVANECVRMRFTSESGSRKKIALKNV